MVNMADLPGVLAGRYEPRARLGARTLRAWDRRLRREVVVVTYTGPRAGPDAIARHVAAVAAARRAAHPSLVLPIDLVSEGADAPLAVFEPLAGQDLAALQRQSGALLWARAAEITSECARVLAAVATATGLAHRALGPGNVWISASGEVLVLGFGAAEFGVTPASQRADGSFAEYRAPEQLDSSAGDVRSDVHALGVLLFEMTTGVHPFAADSAFKAAHNLLLLPTPSLASFVGGLPEPALRAADGLIQRALARRPDDRFKSVEEFARALELTRRTVGSPVHRVTAPKASVPVAKAPVVETDDFTTMLSLRVVREMSVQSVGAVQPVAPVQQGEPMPQVEPVKVVAPVRLAEPVQSVTPVRPVVPVAAAREVVEPTEVYPRISAQPNPARARVLEPLPRRANTASERAEPTETLELVANARPRPETTEKLADGARPEATEKLDGGAPLESIDDAATMMHRRIEVVARPLPGDSEATRMGPYRPPAALQVAAESGIEDAGMSRSAVQSALSRSKLAAQSGLMGSNRLLIALNVLCAILIVVGLVLLWRS